MSKFVWPLPVSFTLFIVILLSGCNQTWGPIYDGYQQMWRYNDEGQFDRSVAYFKQHIGYHAPVFSVPPEEIAEPQSKQRNWVMVYTCQGFLKLRDFTEFSHCIDHFEKINQQMLARQDYDIEYYARAQVLNLKSQYQLSLERYDEVIENSLQVKDILRGRLASWEDYLLDGAVRAQWSWLEVERLRLQALAQAFSGERQKAEQLRQQLEAIELTNWGSSGARYKKAMNLALAQIYMAQGQYQLAGESLKRYDNIDVGGIVGTGSVAFLLGPVGIAAATVNMVAAYDEASRNDSLRQMAFFNLPKLFMGVKAGYEAGNVEQAEKGYAELLEIDDFAKVGEIYYVALYDMGRIQRDRGRLEQAEKYFSQAIDVIESQRATLNTEASKIGFVGDKQSVYLDMVALQVALKHYDQALLYAERGKARALVDLLAEKETFAVAQLPQGKTTQLLQAFDQADISYATQNYSTSDSERSRQRALLRKRKKALTQASPQLSSLISVQAPAINELQKSLSADETLVEYYGDSKKMYAFLVTRKGIGAVSLDTANLERNIQSFRQTLSDPQQQGYTYYSRQLYNQLIRPLVSGIHGDKLIIVAHGAMHYLPFSALSSGNHYLVDKYAVSVLPSASVIPYLKGKSHAAKNLLALGNPTLDLPGTQKEVKAISHYQLGTTVLLRQQATETRIKEDGGLYRLLHLATHGVFEPDDPLQSGIMLAKDKHNDGYLSVDELYSLSLDADIVTLSACETALGKTGNGDDVIGFTRGFLYSGARTIVSSLWKVDDQATSELMNAFYQNMQKRSSKTALRLAQLQVRKQYPHPYYWASFQMVGGVH